jgi:hypothetical protein
MTHHKPIQGRRDRGQGHVPPPSRFRTTTCSINYVLLLRVPPTPLRIFSSYAFPTTYLQRRCRIQRSFNRQYRRSKHLGPVLIKGHLRKKVLLLSELKFDVPFCIPGSVGPSQNGSSSYQNLSASV